jgi:hypothetical protein
VVSQLCYTAPHGNKETKLSHLNLVARKKGCVKGIQIKCGEIKESRTEAAQKT